MIGSMGSLAWLASVGLLLWYSWSHGLHSAALSPSQYLRDRARFAARNPSPAMAVSARCRTASARAWKRSVLLAVRRRCCVAESRRALLRPRRARVTGRPGHRGATNVRRHMRWSFAGCAGAHSLATHIVAGLAPHLSHRGHLAWRATMSLALWTIPSHSRHSAASSLQQKSTAACEWQYMHVAGRARFMIDGCCCWCCRCCWSLPCCCGCGVRTRACRIRSCDTGAGCGGGCVCGCGGGSGGRGGDRDGS